MGNSNQSSTVIQRKEFPPVSEYLPGLYYNVIDGLRLMASTYEELREELPDFVGDVTDDAVISFSDGYLYLPALSESGVLSQEQVELFLKIYNQIDLFPQESYELEDQEQMALPEWIKCREMSRELLKMLGEKLPEEY